MEKTLISKLTETVEFLKSRTNLKPKIGVILGSGLGGFVSEMNVECEIEYSEIPNFPTTTVTGHKGKFFCGSIEGVEIAVLQGRVHYYEGHSMDDVVYPTRTLAMLGIETLLLTNSAGGLDPKMKPGEFMIIEDHINLMGDNPLKGPNLSELGPRFPDMTEAYDRKLSADLETIMKTLGLNYHKGIYTGVSGPTYETPAEVRMLGQIGGKAVGMSTVPESIAANHLGLRVCAVSCITNLAAGLSQNKLSHEEVTETAKLVEKNFSAILRAFIAQNQTH
jgi:purine-nucleoside phosphorylase